MAVQKKQGEEKPVETKPKQAKTEPVVVSDVVTETSEKIEVIEEVIPKEVKQEEKKSDESSPPTDPLSEFKEKMIEEELPGSDNAPKKNFMWPILFIFIAAVVLLVGIFIYKQGIFKGETVNVATLSPTPSASPEPTKTIDLAKYEIEVLNGSGARGEASRQQVNLEEEGFVVSSIGNADNSDYTDTIIKAKAEVDKDFVIKLKSVLENSFTVAATEALSEDNSTAVVVILGTKK